MREHANRPMSAVYTGQQLFNLQLLLPPLVGPRTEVWTVHDGVGWGSSEYRGPPLDPARRPVSTKLKGNGSRGAGQSEPQTEPKVDP